MTNLCWQALDAKIDAGLGDAPAFVFVGGCGGGALQQRSFTYREMRDGAARIAGGLRALGVAKGDPVAIYLPKIPELYSTILACARIGAIAMPAPDVYRRDVMKHRLRDSGAKLLVTQNDLVGQIEFDELPDLATVALTDEPAGPRVPVRAVRWRELTEAAPVPAVDVADDDPLVLHYTAGAMGKPRGILHAHRAGKGLESTSREILGLREGVRVWCTVHAGWIMGTAYSIYGPLLCGATSIVHTDPFDAATWSRMLAEARVEVWYTVPSALHRLKEAGGAAGLCTGADRLRLVMTSGERLSASLVDWVRACMGLQVLDSWWMTETGMISLAQRPGKTAKPGSIGAPVAGIEAAVVSPEGKPLPANQIGLLALRKGWPAMMSAVWKDPAAYAACFRGDWFITGDYVHVDDDGQFHFQGRTEETIKVMTERVNPFEVEDALLSHPAVAEVAVIGKAGQKGRELIKAFVVLVAGFEAGPELIESLRRHVAQAMGPLGRPDEIEFMPSLPKTRLGKVLRRVLRAREEGLPPGDTSTMTDGKIG